MALETISALRALDGASGLGVDSGPAVGFVMSALQRAPRCIVRRVAAMVMAAHLGASLGLADSDGVGPQTLDCEQSPVVLAARAAGHWDAAFATTLARSVAALRRDAQQTSAASTTLLEKAQSLHMLLREQLFTGHYQADHLDVADTLDSGDYNCVTAAVWLLELADAAGVEARCVERPGHVFCVFRAELTDEESRGAATWRRWEPTCADWDLACGVSTFQIRDDERFLSLAGLVAKVYCNRSIVAQRWAAPATRLTGFAPPAGATDARAGVCRTSATPFPAWEDAILALLLDPTCDVANANLRGLINNEAARRAINGDTRSAMAIWRLAAAVWSDYLPFQVNLAHYSIKQ